MTDTEKFSGPVLISLIRSHEGQQDRFAQAWRASAQRLGRVEGLACHIQNLVQPEHVPMAIGRGPWRIDGLSQMHFESKQALEEMVSSKEYALHVESLASFASHCLDLGTWRHVVIPAASAAQGLLKRMSLLQRQPGVSNLEFRRWWIERHGPKVAGLGALNGANQFHVMNARLVLGSADKGFDQIPDGVTELLLADVASMIDTFSPSGTAITDHAASMIGKITPMLMHEVSIAC